MLLLLRLLVDSLKMREKLQLRFDIANFVATENLPFTKYTRICALEAHHGVQLGPSYINENAGKETIHYIAETRRQQGIIYPGSHRTLRAKNASSAIQFHQCIAKNCYRTIIFFLTN